jgi:protein-L-isoaspartate O-methyltransferase
MTLAQWRQHLADAMERRGDWPARSPWIRRAVAALPRDRYAPDRLFDWDGHTYQTVDRHDRPELWAQLLYLDQDTAAVTQVTDGLPTSSLSCQAVVVDMLDSLLLEPGQRVLELGTGSGWNSALLARRAGLGRVTSIEVDPGLADAARPRLPGVEVRIGDGARGGPADAPYDRVISTYAVDRVPWAWVEQTRPAGRIVTPWGPLGHVALTVSDDGRSASGWVQGLAQFMPARADLVHSRDYREIRGGQDPDGERAIERNLAPLRDDQHLRFALRVAAPDLRITTAVDRDGVSAWIHDGNASWAALSATGDGRVLAYQGGARRLADELEAAWDQWLGLGSPGLYEYGLTVTAHEQYAWALDPETGPRWRTTAHTPAMN